MTAHKFAWQGSLIMVASSSDDDFIRRFLPSRKPRRTDGKSEIEVKTEQLESLQRMAKTPDLPAIVVSEINETIECVRNSIERLRADEQGGSGGAPPSSRN